MYGRRLAQLGVRNSRHLPKSPGVRNGAISSSGLNRIGCRPVCRVETFVPTDTVSNCDKCVLLPRARVPSNSLQHGRLENPLAVRYADPKVHAFETRSTTPPPGRRNIPLASSDSIRSPAEGSGRHPSGTRLTDSELRTPGDLESIQTSSFSAALRTSRRPPSPTWLRRCSRTMLVLPRGFRSTENVGLLTATERLVPRGGRCILE